MFLLWRVWISLLQNKRWWNTEFIILKILLMGIFRFIDRKNLKLTTINCVVVILDCNNLWMMHALSFLFQFVLKKIKLISRRIKSSDMLKIFSGCSCFSLHWIFKRRIHRKIKIPIQFINILNNLEKVFSSYTWDYAALVHKNKYCKNLQSKKYLNSFLDEMVQSQICNCHFHMPMVWT